ncbi:MAG: glycosyltransferase family 4 protein [Pseudomonadales bacterium]|nr:glycosyltransferase family 4 protein [Pseudomonadales bacterium]
MNIIFLSHYFPPEVNAPASRTYEHCKEWAKQGHNVTVITCFPNHPNGVIYKGYKNRLFQRENIDGINVIRIWSYLAANEGFSQRILNYLSFMLMSILLCFKTPKADVVASTSPQFFCGMAGYFVSKLKAAKWVLEIRDLWPESIVAVGAMKKGFVIRLLYWLELFCYRKAHTIVSVTDSFKDYMINKGIDSEKIHVIKNGVSLDLYDLGESQERAEQVAAFRKEHELEGKFVASYVGTHGMAHHLETILKAAQRTATHENIVYLLVGDGAERERLCSLREEYGVTHNVRMIKQLPKSMMPIVLMATDVSLVHLKKSPTFKTVIPSKIFESLAMKRPILLGVEGESAALIEKSKGGICFEPESDESLADALLELSSKPEKMIQMREAGRRFVVENYNRVDLAKDYTQLFSALINQEKLASSTAPQ